MNLYAVTSAKETTFILALDMETAIGGWNDHNETEGQEPDTVAMVADPDQLVMRSESEEMQALRLEVSSARTERNEAHEDLHHEHEVVGQLKALRADIVDILRMTRQVGDTAMTTDEKIRAELTIVKAQSNSYHTYIVAKASSASSNAATLAQLQHRVSTLENEVKIANDKLDAKEGAGCP